MENLKAVSKQRSETVGWGGLRRQQKCENLLLLSLISVTLQIPFSLVRSPIIVEEGRKRIADSQTADGWIGPKGEEG